MKKQLDVNLILTQFGNKPQENAICLIDQECRDTGALTLTGVHSVLAQPGMRAILAVTPLNETTTRAIGYAIFQILHGSDPRVVVHSLVVRPAYRRKQVGTAMLKAIGEFMADVAPSVETYLSLDNRVGLEFLKAFNASIADGALGEFKLADKQENIVGFRMSVAMETV